MNIGRTVFSQLIEHLPSKEFQKCVARYDLGMFVSGGSLVGTSYWRCLSLS